MIVSMVGGKNDKFISNPKILSAFAFELRDTPPQQDFHSNNPVQLTEVH
jgi:hypothetical protein